jgi:hypothetical protein
VTTVPTVTVTRKVGQLWHSLQIELSQLSQNANAITRTTYKPYNSRRDSWDSWRSASTLRARATRACAEGTSPEICPNSPQLSHAPISSQNVEVAS